MAWSTSPAATELEQVVLDWLAQLLGLPRGWHGHIEDTASTARRGARAPRASCGPAASSTRPSTRTSRSRRRCGSSGSSTGTVPVDDEFRMTTDFPLERRHRGRRDGRDDLVDLRRPGARARRPLRAGGRLAPRRRGLRRARRRSAPSSAGASTAATAPTRSSSTRTSGSSRRSTARRSGRGGPRRCTRAFAAHGDYLASSEGALDLRDYGPALGRRFRALKLWTVLRCYGREGLQALIREHVRLAALFEEWVRGRARLGGRGAAALLDRLLPARSSADNDEIARTRDRDGRGLRRDDEARAAERVIRLAIGNARTQEADVRRAWEVLRECAR